MSTELKGCEALNGQVLLTRYFGGVKDGTCLQVTPYAYSVTPYLQLTKSQALEMAAALVEFANDTREEVYE
jgi:hypothetical protein